MPAIRFERFAPKIRAIVWEGSESPAELLAPLPEAWRGQLSKNAVRLKDTLSARRALLELAPQAAKEGFEKNSFGKPHFKGQAKLEFSLSHSHGHAAALVSPYACGVDLQLRVDKITKLRSKFENIEERAFIERQEDEVGALHVLWGAKESLFKLWGRRLIDWHDHLIVSEFEHNLSGGQFKGEVRKDGLIIPAHLWFRWIGNYCLVAAVTDI